MLAACRWLRDRFFPTRVYEPMSYVAVIRGLNQTNETLRRGLR